MEVHREGPHDPLHVVRGEAVYQGAQPLVERGVVVEPQALAQEPYLLLRLEEPPAFLFDQDLPEDPTQQVDVPPQRLVFGLEPDPGREVRVPGPRRLEGCLPDRHVR
ncbi:MAG: hypothetical protein H0X19_13435 [Rubrobacter sp.]|nr:hypothetical protein [Rubrobacter sp.]